MNTNILNLFCLKWIWTTIILTAFATTFGTDILSPKLCTISILKELIEHRDVQLVSQSASGPQCVDVKEESRLFWDEIKSVPLALAAQSSAPEFVLLDPQIHCRHHCPRASSPPKPNQCGAVLDWKPEAVTTRSYRPSFLSPRVLPLGSRSKASSFSGVGGVRFQAELCL